MAQTELDCLNDLLAGQISRMQQYGELLDEQERFLAAGDHEQLAAVVERKGRLLGRLDKWDRIAELARSAPDEPSEKRWEAEERFGFLLERMNDFAARETRSRQIAAGVQEDISAGLKALRKGKKLLRKYFRLPHNSKARFKDITT